MYLNPGAEVHVLPSFLPPTAGCSWPGTYIAGPQGGWYLRPNSTKLTKPAWQETEIPGGIFQSTVGQAICPRLISLYQTGKLQGPTQPELLFEFKLSQLALWVLVSFSEASGLMYPSGAGGSSPTSLYFQRVGLQTHNQIPCGLTLQGNNRLVFH